MTPSRYRNTSLLTDAKLASASAIATTLFAIFVPGSPLWAAEMIFTSAGSDAPSGENGTGEQQIGSGLVQLKLDDGTIVSIVGPARYSLSGDGQLSVASGSFTAAAPAGSTPKPILAGNGSQIVLKPGSSANGKIAADGSFAGFALSGSMQVASNGSSRNFQAGKAFKSGNGSGPSAAVTAGTQPNRSSGSTPLQQVQQAQRNAAQFLANASQTTPTALGFAGVSQPQTFIPGTLQAATTPAQWQALVQAQTGPLDPAVALRFITDILAALQSTGGLGSYTGLTPTQIQALLFNLQTFGAPAGISQFQLEQFLRALGNAGYTITGIAGQGPSFGSLADLLALVAAGGTIPPGDPTVQALVDLLFANPFPPGLDVDEIARLFRLAGYTVPPQYGGGTGGTPTPSPTPTPTPTPPPVLAASDGVRPDGSRDDSIIAFAKITENGLDQDVTLIFENDQFVGYRMQSGFEIRFADRDEVEKGGDQGIIGWSRLAGGTKVLGAPRGANSGDHFVYGLPLANRPASGIATYELIGLTSPTIRDDSLAPGSFDGSMAVSFGASDIFMGLDAKVLFSSDIYDVLTDGGLTAPSVRVFPDGRFGGTVDLPDGVGIACNQGDCRFVFNGFLAGDGASHAGLAYTIRDDRGNDVSKWIDGSTAFRKAGAAGGNPPPASGTVRQNQYVVYAAGNNIGIDSRNPAPDRDPPLPLNVTYAASGAPISYEWTASESPNIGTAREFESGSVGEIIGWTRWADGTTGGAFYSNPEKTFAANQGWHILAGSPATNIPASGSVRYELVGATAPTIRDGSLTPGSFSGNLAVAFGATPMAGFDFAVAIGGSNYSFGTAGGASDPGNGGRPIETTGEFAFTFFGNGLPVTGSGPVCAGAAACSASLRGFLAGDAASHVGISYTFGSGTFDQRVDGVAAFGMEGFAATAASGSLAGWSRWTGDKGASISAIGFEAAPVRPISGGESIATIRERLGRDFSFR